jgi:hypothetical protein
VRGRPAAVKRAPHLDRDGDLVPVALEYGPEATLADAFADDQLRHEGELRRAPPRVADLLLDELRAGRKGKGEGNEGGGLAATEGARASSKGREQPRAPLEALCQSEGARPSAASPEEPLRTCSIASVLSRRLLLARATRLDVRAGGVSDMLLLPGSADDPGGVTIRGGGDAAPAAPAAPAATAGAGVAPLTPPLAARAGSDEESVVLPSDWLWDAR